MLCSAPEWCGSRNYLSAIVHITVQSSEGTVKVSVQAGTALRAPMRPSGRHCRRGGRGRMSAPYLRRVPRRAGYLHPPWIWRMTWWPLRRRELVCRRPAAQFRRRQHVSSVSGTGQEGVVHRPEAPCVVTPLCRNGLCIGGRMEGTQRAMPPRVPQEPCIPS